MLIDDEYAILEGLRHLVNWEECGAEIVGMYTNPHEAAHDAARLMPDVIFTDIEMPELSGLELIAALKEENPGATFVILSAYDSFRYAQEAIVLQVYRYLLKPISSENLKELLADLTEKKVSIPSKEKEADTPELYESEADTLIKKSLELIEEKYGDPDFKLSSIADSLFVNYSYLSHLFKTKTGRTLFSYLLDTRMEHASALLLETGLPIAEIARKTGYALTKNFHEAFRKYYGESPKNYRRTKKNEAL